MRGKACPIPVIECKKALKTAAPGETVFVLVDNEVAKQNLWRLAQKHNCLFSCEEQADGIRKVSLQTPGEEMAAAKMQGGLVVAIGSSCMGRGDEALGKMLMKSYLYSLTELDTPPAFLLLFNSGVHLAVEDAASVEDLHTLEKNGTQIAVCGACLDYYKLKEKLAAGFVSNMYAIASTMAAAETLVNL